MFGEKVASSPPPSLPHHLQSHPLFRSHPLPMDPCRLTYAHFLLLYWNSLVSFHLFDLVQCSLSQSSPYSPENHSIILSHDISSCFLYFCCCCTRKISFYQS